MKKIISIIFMLAIVLAISSCAKKEKVDTSKAPKEIKNAVENSYQLSKKLTDLQLEAGKDGVLDSREISDIGTEFKKLALVNNSNEKEYASDKYFITLKKERKDEFDRLADTVVFLRECKGYDELGLAIQKMALEVNKAANTPSQ